MTGDYTAAGRLRPGPGTMSVVRFDLPETGRALDADFYRRPAAQVARDLLGCLLVRHLDGETLTARIVETEAYLGEPDRASHAWGGRRTPRVASLYLDGGHVYVYFVYGMHHCFNVVTGAADNGGAVLIRAAEAVTGTVTMRRLRGRSVPVRPGDLLGGPAKLCQALAIDRRLDGVRLDSDPVGILAEVPAADAAVVCGPRVGVGYAGEAAGWPLRFAVRDHPEVSRPRPVLPLSDFQHWWRKEHRTFQPRNPS